MPNQYTKKTSTSTGKKTIKARGRTKAKGKLTATPKVKTRAKSAGG